MTATTTALSGPSTMVLSCGRDLTMKSSAHLDAARHPPDPVVPDFQISGKGAGSLLCRTLYRRARVRFLQVPE
jgi:hypothetical protein